MNNNTKAISFWNFLKENTIEIPIIQRDYAQGRLGKENLRKNFLGDLKKALDNEPPYKDSEMKLDFVYGSTENGRLYPLDGQQRLTTLWLLHWYIALRAGMLNEENCVILRKFTYETRISSREFCQNLCIPKYFENFYERGMSIVDFITNQTWFYSAWKQDPTIQSMLRMLGGTRIVDKKGEDILDGFEEIFHNTDQDTFKLYWHILTEKGTIVFYHLPLQNFGLSDDLYIKMNARGKQLTSFENFKADLIGYITKQSQDESLDELSREKWKTLLDIKNGIPIMLDTDWTNIFWMNKSSDYKIDEIYFAFINRLFLQELVCAKNDDNSYLYPADKLENENVSFRHLYGDKGDDSKIQYLGLGKYFFYENKVIPFSFFTTFRNTLNKFKTVITDCKKVNYLNTCFPTWVNSKFEFIPKYDEKGNISTLGQKERVVLLAICKYFENGKFMESSFMQWMRVVWNIVENSETEMIGAMRLVDELSVHSQDIYNFLLSKAQTEIKSAFAKEQVSEEINKAKQILDEKGNLRTYNGSCKKEDGSNYQTWEEIIVEAEKYAFFKGSIRFLFTDANGKCNWTDFDTKWENIKSLIPVETEKRKTIKLMIPYLNDTDIKEIFSKRTFSNKDYNLKKLLLDFPHKVDAFFMQINQCQQGETLLQKDLVYLCTEYPDYWIHCSWQYNFDILSQYQNRSGYYEFESYVVGSDFIKKRLELLHKISDISIKEKTSNESPWKGLFIDFKYKECLFRWKLNDWIDMFDNQRDDLWKEGLHSHYNGSEKCSFNNEDSLIKELDRCVEKYNSMSNLSELSEK